ncbi:3-oxoacyl-[acyl-carrier-protein] synthase III C-terminal domain-containing protein [Convivina praedatoris]|uniref:3-oxoacyl-[acyl-carrier-protein] synthase 3 n=1 Tax=Convivina praedatoris TaxID=2880963 RepID=A0ABN8HDG9_9LACO|nr:3-oxoacyl-[acyl-carrier-protein] synthase III C-terminal domain-containing protein [Convivina sp. LMG 32447]CAH1853855.1 3-oxoacyl-[acyl-carrier-protein] synthase 3 [Convivina sp. LMG 32447]CAH1854632.1 3-oxoacyl-[acyl-carrier-protein] synthase 3 [Convivina sp. LMG 32447]CAH1855266.1 3-oxoacyl-[acyl-carrier-protein] synthase 3 [Convivina sp. LMG 32447]
MTQTATLISMGLAEPDNIVYTKDLAERMGVDPKWAERVTGIHSRRHTTVEGVNDEGIRLAKASLDQALQRADLKINDLDVIICASAVPSQAIPATAPLLQAAYGEEAAGIPAFDINATCISFVTAFDLMANMISLGKYQRVGIVSTDLPSLSLNFDEPKNALLFGDGSAAAILGVDDNQAVHVLANKMATYGSGAHDTEIRGGGSAIPPKVYAQQPKTDFMFHMDGQATFRLAMRKVPDFVDELLQEAGLDLKDIDMVVPHQASGLAMKIMKKHLGIPDDKFYSIIEDHGNMVSASIPTTLAMAIDRGDIKRGDKVLLIGTAAGLTMQGLIFEY